MHRFLGILFLLVAGLATAPAHAFGWRELPSTRLLDVCPPSGFGGSGYDFPYYCKNITAAWNSAAFDKARNRLYIWGGGHTDYAGNEIYALDLSVGAMIRLTDPALPFAVGTDGPASELHPHDGTQPNSRHTYGGLAFLDHVDRLWAFGGSLYPSSGFDSVTWLFDPTASTWQRVETTGDTPSGQYGLVSAYDPVTKRLYMHDRSRLYAYDHAPDGGHYTRLSEQDGLGIHANAVIDPERRLMFIFGPKMDYVYDISQGSNFERETVESTGDLGIFRHQAPGLAYDPVEKVILGWTGDGRIYRFDPDTRHWTSTAFKNGPGPQTEAGTFGRFAYVPTLDEFVVYNRTHQNAFLLRPARGAGDVQAPSAPATVSGKALLPTVAVINWSPGDDNFGVSGYRVYRDGVLATETSRTKHSELGLSPGTSYKYSVTSLDSAGHESHHSATVTVQTPLPQVALPLGDCSAETNLATRDDVVFCEPWESSDWWSNGYLRDPIVADPRPARDSDVSRAQIVSDGCFSGNCLKVDMVKGETGSLALHWPLAAAEQAPEELFIRYFIRLAPDWSPSMCNAQGDVVGAGGKFPGIADPRTWADPGGQCGNGGARGDGLNCWSMRANYRDCVSNDGEACATKPDAVIRFGSYLYHYDQYSATGDAGHWDGDDWNQTRHDQGTCASNPNNMYCGMGDGGVLERDRWYRIEMQVKMNTPGESDGVIRGWVDGTLSFEKTNTVLRLPEHDMLHNRVVWLNVYKGGILGNCNDSAVYLDQLAVTTGAPPGGLDADTVQPPELDFEINPRSVAAGDPVALDWRASRAESCTASQDWSGTRPLEGNESQQPSKEITTYELTCTGTGGTVRRRLSVDVAGGSPTNPIADDVEPPAQPAAPAATVITDTRIDLHWPEPSDDHGVTGYRVFRNGAAAGTVSEPHYSDTVLSPGTTYRYAIEAFDAAGNFSQRSSEASYATNGDSGADSGALTLYPDSDTYTHSSTVSTLGGSARVEVGTGINAFLRFPLDALPQDAVIKSARLRLFTTAQFGSLPRAGVFRADKDWHESVATKTLYDRTASLAWEQIMGDWSDQAGAAHGALPFAEQSIVDDDTAKWVEWDITLLVRAWQTGTHPNQGLVLRSLEGAGVQYFSSKEHADPGQRPRLEIELESEQDVEPVPDKLSGEYFVSADQDTFTHGSTTSALGAQARMEVGPGAIVYLRFPLTDVPASSNLRRATLRLYSYAQYGHISSAGVFRADKPWREQQATKSHYDSGAGLTWNNPLGDWIDRAGQPQGNDPITQTPLVDDDTGKWVEWDVTGLVRSWLDGTESNQGLVLRTVNSSGTHYFRTKEYTQQDLSPHLALEFGDAPQSEEHVASADTFLSGSTYRALGELPRLEIYGPQSALLRFDLAAVPPGSEVESAVLRLYDYAQYGHLPAVGVYAVNKPWTEVGASRTYYDGDRAQVWDNYLGDWSDAEGSAQGDVPYAEIAIVDDDTAKWAEWDVTDLVKAWVGGTLSNHGLMLRSKSGFSTHLFSSREDPDPEHHPRLEVRFR